MDENILIWFHSSVVLSGLKPLLGSLIPGENFGYNFQDKFAQMMTNLVDVS